MVDSRHLNSLMPAYSEWQQSMQEGGEVRATADEGAPLKGRPARPMDMIMERETRRWSQSAVLSPVQMGPIA